MAIDISYEMVQSATPKSRTRGKKHKASKTRNWPAEKAARQEREQCQAERHQQLLDKLRRHPFLELFSAALVERIRREDGSDDDILGLLHRLNELARCNPERVTSLACMTRLNEARLEVRRQHFAVVKCLRADSWYYRLYNQPVAETFRQLIAEGKQPLGAYLHLDRGIKQIGKRWLETNTGRFAKSPPPVSTSRRAGKPEKSDNDRRLRQKMKGPTIPASKFGQGKTKNAKRRARRATQN